VERPSAEILVRAPDARPIATVVLSGARVTVGRLPELNDIALQPDPELYVSRASHFTFERANDGWLLVDGGSVNGTYVRRGATLERVAQRASLRDGDVVCVLAAVGKDGRRTWFELAYQQSADEQRTRAAPVTSVHETAGCLVYDEDAARLVFVRGDVRQEVHLRPQGHRLVRYMAERNRTAGGAAVLCGHDELMRAVWEDEPMHTRLELARLVWELRRELRRVGAEDLVESERRRGYRLKTCPGS
jgi:DNA-binding winged helix-turn-helix (wHTH) protein